MSEISDQGPQSGPAGASAAPAGSAGALIRRAREDAGMHIAALAVALKVPVKRLEALEADRHDLLPDAVFARALAGSVCRSLKLDPSPVLSLLPQSSVQAPTVEGPINEPFQATEQGPRGWRPQVSRPAVIAACVLAVGALAVYLLPQLDLRMPVPASVVPAAVPAPPAGDRAGTPAPAPGTVVEPVPSATLPGPSTPGPADAPPAVVPVVPQPPAMR